MRFPSLQKCLTVLMLTASSAVMAQDAGFPGGATTLRESFGDWTVSCAIGEQDGKPARVCALTQQQVNTEGKHVLSIELHPESNGAAGTLVLPFGLDLVKGAGLQVDERQLAEPLPYSTCIPLGCLISLTLNADAVSALRAGGLLTAQPTVLGGDNAEFGISLTGFSAAFNRVSELLS